MRSEGLDVGRNSRAWWALYWGYGAQYAVGGDGDHYFYVFGFGRWWCLTWGWDDPGFAISGKTWKRAYGWPS